MFNWAMSQAEYCVKRKIVLPFPFERVRYIVKDINTTSMIGQLAKNYPLVQVDDFAGLLRYIRGFNKKTARREGEKIIIFQEELWRKIKKITNPYLYEYIEFLNLKDFISGEFHILDADSEELL